MWKYAVSAEDELLKGELGPRSQLGRNAFGFFAVDKTEDWNSGL